MKKSLLFSVGLLLVASFGFAGTIKPTGVNQGDLVNYLTDVRDVVNEIQTDHATFKTNADQTETLIEELHDDHATFKTAADQTETLIEELHDDHATFRTVVTDLKTLVNDIRTQLQGDYIITTPTLAIGSDTSAVSYVAFNYVINGIPYAKAVDATGVEPGNDAIPQNKFGAVRFQIGADGTVDVVEATDNATGYDSAVLAVAGLPALASDHASMGTVTASDSSGVFTFGTTALNAANTTVAYTNGSSPFVAIGAAVSTSPPATLTAPKPASAPATLTAPKPASAPATLTNNSALSLTQ